MKIKTGLRSLFRAKRGISGFASAAPRNFTRKRFLLTLLIPLAFTQGCGMDRDEVIRDIKAKAVDGYLIEGVPFFPQDEYMCGPAALASVIGYHGPPRGEAAGVNRAMVEVAKEVYLEKLKGTLPMDLLIYAKDKGFDAAYYDGSMNDLREKLRERRPLILFLNMGFESYPIGHYIVVVGYNDRMEAVIAHSGLNREEVWRYPDLLRRWEKTGYGTLLITPRQRP